MQYSGNSKITQTHIVIVAGDLDALPNSEIIIRTGLKSIVTQPTRGNSYLDRICVSDHEYNGIKVVASTVKSNHRTIIAYTNV